MKGSSAAGRLSSFSGYLGDGGANRTYSTGIIYSSPYGMAKEQLGTDTPLYNKSFYNSRGQLSEIRVGTTYSGPTDGGIIEVRLRFSKMAGLKVVYCGGLPLKGSLTGDRLHGFLDDIVC
jgi:hypothetical protein